MEYREEYCEIAYEGCSNVGRYRTLVEDSVWRIACGHCLEQLEVEGIA